MSFLSSMNEKRTEAMLFSGAYSQTFLSAFDRKYWKQMKVVKIFWPVVLILFYISCIDGILKESVKPLLLASQACAPAHCFFPGNQKES